MGAISTEKIEAQALDVMGLVDGDLPAFSLTFKIQDAIDGILSDWPALDDGSDGITLTNAREVRAFERAAGAETAAKFLDTAKGADLFRKVKKLKLGDIEKEWANAPVPEPGAAAATARVEKTNALRRIDAISGTIGTGVLFARSGATVPYPEGPQSLLDQAFGPNDSTDDYANDYD